MKIYGFARFCAAISGVLILSIAVSSCQTSKPWEGMEPDDIPSLMKEEFEIRKGTSRVEVEEVLGLPAQVGRTKEGYPFAQYEYGFHVRHVVYDFNDNAIVAYPY